VDTKFLFSLLPLQSYDCKKVNSQEEQNIWNIYLGQGAPEMPFSWLDCHVLMGTAGD
jgi:hypothetical protein